MKNFILLLLVAMCATFMGACGNGTTEAAPVSCDTVAVVGLPTDGTLIPAIGGVTKPISNLNRVPVLYAQVDSGGSFMDWLKTNYVLLFTLLFFVAETLVRLTPSEKDDSIINWLKRQIDKLLPNKSADGGQHV